MLSGGIPKYQAQTFFYANGLKKQTNKEKKKKTMHMHCKDEQLKHGAVTIHKSLYLKATDMAKFSFTACAHDNVQSGNCKNREDAQCVHGQCGPVFAAVLRPPVGLATMSVIYCRV